jgi:hypothetical protein
MTTVTDTELIDCDGGYAKACFEIDITINGKPGHAGICIVWPF